MTGALHDDELVVDEALVARLLAEQLPHLAGKPLRRLTASGSSNVLFRLGPDLLVRLPRQPGGSADIDKEARWSGVLAGRLPVAVPEVVAVGRAGEGYPESWSVVRWVDGTPPLPYDGTARPELAEQLGAVVVALGTVPVPEGEPREELHWYRCDALTGLDETVELALADLARPGSRDWGLDLARITRTWQQVRTAQPGPVAVTWIHADLVAENLLVRDGALAAVLDLGGVAVGRPAVDLMAAWELFGPDDRARFRHAAGDPDDAAWATGAGWALALALMTLTYYGDTMPGRCASRLVMARQVLDELG